MSDEDQPNPKAPDPVRRSLVLGRGACGIGRAIAVEFAANGADVVILGIAAPVSPASDAEPATLDDMAGTVRQVQGCGLPRPGPLPKRAGGVLAPYAVIPSSAVLDVASRPGPPLYSP